MEGDFEHWHSNREARMMVRRARGPARLRGLIGMPPPGQSCALLLPNCRAVHGFAMRYAIDVVFLDSRLQVLRIHALNPARVLACRAATHVLEMRAGECERLGIAIGDCFEADRAREERRGVVISTPAANRR